MTPQHWQLPPAVDGGIATALREHADARYGVVRRQDLLQIGITDSQVDRCLNAGRWQAVTELVIVLHNTAFTPCQQEMVATSVGGNLCALAARTAAAAAGLAGWPAPCLEILVPRGAEYPRLPFPVRVHESRRFTADDVVETWPRRVSIERALIDAAAWAQGKRTACGLVAAGVQQRLTTPARLLGTLDTAGQIRHRGLLRCALRDIEGGAQAVSEMDLLRWCRRHGFPMPVMQQVRRDSAGRRRYIDATFVSRDGRVIRVEVDGALHLVIRTYWDDMVRGNDIAIDRETQLRFPSYVIYSDDERAIDQLRRALNLSGPPAQTAA